MAIQRTVRPDYVLPSSFHQQDEGALHRSHLRQGYGGHASRLSSVATPVAKGETSLRDERVQRLCSQTCVLRRFWSALKVLICKFLCPPIPQLRSGRAGAISLPCAFLLSVLAQMVFVRDLWAWVSGGEGCNLKRILV